MIDPKADHHLWSDSYDHELSDIFSLQREIAQSIVNSVQDEIGPHTVIVKRPTENIEAYELFLVGRHGFYQRGAAIDTAIRALKMAVDLDPEFAEAWAFLAAAANVAWAYQTSITNEGARLIAERAANKARDLDPGMALALAAQAMLDANYHGNMIRGFQLIDRAVDADPHDTTIRVWAGMFYHHFGYLEEAYNHFLYAHTQDPRVGITNGMLGQTYLAQGRDHLAAPHLAKATELGWPMHFQTLASQHMMRGEVDAAFAYLKLAFARPGADFDPPPWMHELEEAGRSYIENPVSTGVLMSVVDRAPRKEALTDVCLTLVFDMKDQFFEYLARSIKEYPMWGTFVTPITWLPEYRAYVEDPRYLEIVGGAGSLEVWEQRGFPDGCIRISDPGGDRLDCSQRYQ